MIYFLVNNSYHFLNICEHCDSLKDYKKSLIQVPHTLDKINTNKYFVDIFTYETPFKGIKDLLNLYKIKQIEKKIKDDLHIKESDILFVSTEYEILNQYIISLFKENNARVYILDEGLPTYITYGVKSENGLPLKEKIKFLYIKYILQYSFVEYLYINNLVYPLINEKYIDGVLLYLDVDIVRDIKKYTISRNIEKLSLNSNNVIFLNAKIYSYYCTKDEYANILEDILFKMNNCFEQTYFKFHPRESEEDKIWQLKIINKFDNVKIIKENLPIESLLVQYDSKYIFSFLSAALLNLNAIGAIPVYIYHLYENISKNSVFKQIEIILINAEYKFLNTSYDNLENVGFKNTCLNFHTKNINEFIKKKYQ